MPFSNTGSVRARSVSEMLDSGSVEFDMMGLTHYLRKRGLQRRGVEDRTPMLSSFIERWNKVVLHACSFVSKNGGMAGIPDASGLSYAASPIKRPSSKTCIDNPDDRIKPLSSALLLGGCQLMSSLLPSTKRESDARVNHHPTLQP